MSITELRRRVPSWITTAILIAGAMVTASSPNFGAAPDRGRILGRVRLLAAAAASIPSGVYPSRRVDRPAGAGTEINNVIVFLDDAPRMGELAPTHATITQSDEAFVPRVVAITRGSTVSFPNADPFFHNVFSLSKAAEFDLGRYPRGQSRTRTFPQAGLVKLYCHIHSHMSASIMVFDHPYFTMVAPDGSFAIDNVPPGTYRVSAWHERIGQNARSVRIENGQSAQLEFALPLGSS